MTFTKRPLLAAVAVALACVCACSKKSSSSSSSSCPASNGTAATCTTATLNPSSSMVTTINSTTIPVYVADISTTGGNSYTNEPLVSVTICTPNHTLNSQCQTISNILLDTGSYGLRVFGSAITSNVALTQQTVTINATTYNLGQCEVFGTGADWGAVKSADVILGNQTATNIPIQVIDANFEVIPTACSNLNPDTDPCTAGYNGILGIGPFSYDCGTYCMSSVTTPSVNKVNPGNYFACSGSGCGDQYSGACAGGTCMVTVPLSQQVVNPIAMFPSNNNGLSITLPSVGVGGASKIQGTMTMGISGSVTVATGVFQADPSGMTDSNGLDFRTVFGGITYGSGSNTLSFIDSGSNGLFFPNSNSLPVCSNSTFYCASNVSQTATMKNYSGITSGSDISFTIGNAVSLVNSCSSAFSTIGAEQTSAFDWGLPFFFGRTVYVGFDGATATVNGSTVTGPYWAF